MYITSHSTLSVHSLMIRFPYGPRVKKPQTVRIFFFPPLQKTKSLSEICDLLAKDSRWVLFSFVLGLQLLSPSLNLFVCCSKLATAAVADGWGTFHLSANLLAGWERKSSLKPPVVSRAARRFLLAQVRDPDDVRGFWWKRRSQRSRLPVAAWKRLFRGHQRDARSRAAGDAPVKLVTSGFVQFERLSWKKKCNQLAQNMQVWYKSVQLFLLVLVVSSLSSALWDANSKTCRLVEFPPIFNSIASL